MRFLSNLREMPLKEVAALLVLGFFLAEALDGIVGSFMRDDAERDRPDEGEDA